MKKKIALAFIMLVLGASCMTGCSSVAEEEADEVQTEEVLPEIAEDTEEEADEVQTEEVLPETTEDTEQVEKSDDTEIANSWTESDQQGDATDASEKDREFELNNFFLGEHVRSEDGSCLTITDNNDGTFKIDIFLYRLCFMEDGVGTFENHNMYFEVEDPSGNPLKGMICQYDDNSLAIKIMDSTWGYLTNDEVIEGFGK